MDVYKGTGAFSGIAIGKILYYHKSEYPMRQYEITDVKTELNIVRQGTACAGHEIRNTLKAGQLHIVADLVPIFVRLLLRRRIAGKKPINHEL